MYGGVGTGHSRHKAKDGGSIKGESMMQLQANKFCRSQASALVSEPSKWNLIS
jgi:hypothetical protein